MAPDDILDNILVYLDNNELYPESHTDIKEKLSFDISDKHLQLVLDKLCLDGYIDMRHGKTDGEPNDLKYYHITFHGRLFLSRDGYRQETIIQKRKGNWTRVKTIAATINAMIILVIAASGVYVAWDAKRMSRQLEEKDKQIQQLEQRLDDLGKEKLKSMSANNG